MEVIPPKALKVSPQCVLESCSCESKPFDPVIGMGRRLGAVRAAGAPLLDFVVIVRGSTFKSRAKPFVQLNVKSEN